MKSMFLDRSKDYFEILHFEKERWSNFYFEYVKNAPAAFALYHKTLGLNERDISQRVVSFERRFLDTCYQSLSSLAQYEYETAREIVKLSQRKEIDLSKLKIYIVGALDFEAIYKLDQNRIFVDILALFEVGFSKLPNLVAKKLT